ncbi:hypothetical protein [Nodosilinea nodulosa]|uniref:hypothetical protein n=1 Tax=Nodosilinea nodulosa TaxID=416001 RepID=UPI0002F01791|nr:hypothetical protein [Nodosilinea nodulosa]
MNVRNRILALAAVVLAIAVGLIVWGTALTYAGQGAEPSSIDREIVDPTLEQPLDLDIARDRAEELAGGVYNGLDTTKQLIGKTEARNEAIEHGRDQASSTLQNLADKAQRAEASNDEVLSETDRRILKHISQ